VQERLPAEKEHTVSVCYVRARSRLSHSDRIASEKVHPVRVVPAVDTNGVVQRRVRPRPQALAVGRAERRAHGRRGGRVFAVPDHQLLSGRRRDGQLSGVGETQTEDVRTGNWNDGAKRIRDVQQHRARLCVFFFAAPQVEYSNADDGHFAVNENKVWGFLYFSRNFSESLATRFNGATDTDDNDALVAGSIDAFIDNKSKRLGHRANRTTRRSVVGKPLGRITNCESLIPARVLIERRSG